MPSKFYAVKKGKTPGVFNSWEDCKAQVDGYPGAVYKSFKTATEAAAFAFDISSQKQEISSDEIAVAYVDGSYNKVTQEFSYGVVFFYKGEEIHLKEKFSEPSLASMHNVAGEIKGSEAAMRYAISNGITAVDIYHDYEGIAKWCTGEWKANKEGTIAYKQFFEDIKDTLSVRFIKVKGHSGDKYNDVADRLAKEALGIV
ncbi:MAG: RNase H [Clostridiales bacterium]|nr:RNase H [Clostridiales bacterium]